MQPALLFALVMGCFGAAGNTAAADLKGHGGPVRAIAMLPVSGQAATAGFDATVVIWSLRRGTAEHIFKGHDGPLNAIAVLPDGRIASAGEDGRVLVWQVGKGEPTLVLSGHSGPVAGLAVSPDGKTIASASWDGTARVWSLNGGAAVVLDGHQGLVNAVAFSGEASIVTAGYDGKLRFYDANGTLRRTVPFGLPLNALRPLADGRLVVATAEGQIILLAPDGSEQARLKIADGPIVALAAAPDGKRLAAAGFRGALAIVDTQAFSLNRQLEGPAFPLWSLAFSEDGRSIFTGGSDAVVREWDVATGEPMSPVTQPAADDIPASLRGHPGAAVFRACNVCHSLVGDSAGRAGPSLARLFGRRVGTLPDYGYSQALRDRDIIWTPETLSRLFEIGPAAYLPGTKMPEQQITRPADREALADFLRHFQ